MGATNGFIIPHRPVLVQVFQSLFDHWTKERHTARGALRNVCEATSSLSVTMLKTTPETAQGIDLRSHKFREQPDYNARFKEVKCIPDVEIYPIGIAA